MHELSVCLALLDQVRQIAEERRRASVTKIVLRLGPLSGVEADLLRNAYRIAAAGTVAEYAELVIEDVPVVVSCVECGQQTNAVANRLLCDECGAFNTRIVSGDEMILQTVELDDPSPEGGS